MKTVIEQNKTLTVIALVKRDMAIYCPGPGYTEQ
jgi:K+/H+ antiporter YhaU regulatory subunit KhtT